MIRAKRWKCRAVDAEENRRQVSLSAHRPWKSLRDSHIPTATTTAVSLLGCDQNPGPPAGRFAPAGGPNRNFLLCRD